MKVFLVVAAAAGLVAGCSSGSDPNAGENLSELAIVDELDDADEPDRIDDATPDRSTTTTAVPTTTTTVAPTTTTVVPLDGDPVIEASQDLATTDGEAARTGAATSADGARAAAPAPAPTADDRLVVPSVGIDVNLYASWDDAVFDGGHGGISPWSSQLDTPTGNISIGAHRSSHGGPFRHLWDLAPGDTATVVRPDGSTRSYRFVEHTMVPSTGVEIALPDYLVDGADSGLTLWACTCEDGSSGCISHRVVARFVEI